MPSLPTPVPLPATLPALDAALRDLLLADVAVRPFVCSGSPFDCDVAILGINPGTATPFWPHWSNDGGFDRTAWIAAYAANPANRRKATRPRIERLVRALAPLRVIELNAYPYVTASERELDGRLRDPRVFELMLQVARPRLVFVFGNSPAAEFCRLTGLAALERGVATACSHAGRSFTVLREAHLSRGWSYERVERLAATIRAQLLPDDAAPAMAPA